MTEHVPVATMVPKPSLKRSFVVDSFDEPHWLLWTTPIRSWCWQLIPLADGRTRLISRLHAAYDWRRPGVLITVVLMEFGDYPMLRIRDRVEHAQNS